MNRALDTGSSFWAVAAIWSARSVCSIGSLCSLCAALSETGCVIEAGPAAPNGIAVSGPPPQPVREVPPPPAPGGRAVWVAGYWHWTGLQYTWIPGHWEQAPPGTNWRAPHYSLREGTYFYEPGGWTQH